MADGSTIQARPFRAEAEAIVAAQTERRARTFTGGASWSAMTSPAPAVETAEAVEARLEAQERDAREWLKSPRGRFFSAIRDLEKAGFLVEADTLESIYRQSICELNGPDANPDAVGRSIRILNTIDHAAARVGISALTELLAPLARAA